MAEPSEGKTRRLTLDGEDDNVDRLSPLPQCVLLSILSFLDLKEAAATSILSTNWRDLFIQLPNIDFNFDADAENYIEHPISFYRFTVFAKRVFRERSEETPITNLKLHVRHFTARFRLDLKSLLECMAAAISTFKVKELEINIDYSTTMRARSSSIIIPPAIFSSETLTDLRLAPAMSWNVPECVWLPKVRYARFFTRLDDENSIQRFLNGCPMLENFMLELRVAEDDKVKTLCMSSSSLKVLRVSWDQGNNGLDMHFIVKSESLESLTLSLEGGHKVNMDTPNLKYLCITGQVFEFNGNQNFVSIQEAVIDVECLFHFTDTIDMYSRSRSASRFFNGLQNVRSLSLSENMIKALYASGMAIPTFKNLFKIRLTPKYCQTFPRKWIAQVLFNLFESCPNVEVLAFDQVSKNYYAEDVQFEDVFPLTFVAQLKEIEFSNLKCGEIEYKLVEYFMNNGLSLEMISLTKEDCEHNRGKQNEWNQKERKRILSFKTCSENCEIIFN